MITILITFDYCSPKKHVKSRVSELFWGPRGRRFKSCCPDFRGQRIVLQHDSLSFCFKRFNQTMDCRRRIYMTEERVEELAEKAQRFTAAAITALRL